MTQIDENMMENKDTSPKRSDRRGLASADDVTRQRVASMGGKAAHMSGNAHQFSSDEARAAGRKGGSTVSQNREHMREIGRKGGRNSHAGVSTKQGE